MVKGCVILSKSVNPRPFVRELMQKNPKCFPCVNGECIEVVSDLSELKARLPDGGGYRSGVYTQSDIDACFCGEMDVLVEAMLDCHAEDMEAHSILNGF